MRKLKFRAWIKPMQKMGAVNELYFDGGAFVCGYDFALERDDIEVMQFTGLKDKNGVEIYEGDIVECSYDKEPDKIYGEAVNYDAETGFSPIQNPVDYDETYTGSEFWEVKGNIYENPELLEGK